MDGVRFESGGWKASETTGGGQPISHQPHFGFVESTMKIASKKEIIRRNLAGCKAAVITTLLFMFSSDSSMVGVRLWLHSKGAPHCASNQFDRLAAHYILCDLCAIFLSHLHTGTCVGLLNMESMLSPNRK